MSDNKDYAACAEAWAEYSARHGLSGDKWAVFGDGFDRGVEHARARVEVEARTAATQSGRRAWVKCKDALPDSDVWVLAANDRPDYDSEGHGEPYWAAEGGDLALCNYPHWMPLPAPPKGDTDG